MLLEDAGTVKASYGYKPYGEADPQLTQGDLDTDKPLNPYRYTGKRFDSGSGSLDTGARRFDPLSTRFLQLDLFSSALADLGLSIDPLTANRYSLAAGNPVSFIEWDGHAPTIDAVGTGSRQPAPAKPRDPALSVDDTPSIPGYLGPFDPLFRGGEGYWTVEIEGRGLLSWSEDPVGVRLDLETGTATLSDGDSEVEVGEILKISLVGGEQARQRPHEPGPIGPAASIEFGKDGDPIGAAFGASLEQTLFRA